VLILAMVLTDQGTFQANSSVRAVVGPDGEAHWADPEAPVTSKTAEAGRLILPVTRTAKSTTVRISRFVKLPAESAKAKSAFAARGEPTPPAGCSYRKLSTDVRSTTIGTTYPIGNDKATMVVSSSTGAYYGVAASAKGSGGVFGAFMASNSKFTQSGWGFQWAGYDAARSYRKGIEYGLYELSCVVGCTKCSRSWIPIGETGGTAENRGIARPDWGNCVGVSAGKWWRDRSDGSAYTNSAAVDFSGVIGIDLSIERQYNGNQKVQYTLLQPRRMCGSNGWPSTAGKVMSRYI
jgi:hypothetical protein